MRPTLLTAAELHAALLKLDTGLTENWHSEAGSLLKTFKFKDFQTAFAFMTQVAKAAEALNHHPDWRNIYNRVHITLSTHDAGGITELDFLLASQIEEAASTMLAKG